MKLTNYNFTVETLLIAVVFTFASCVKSVDMPIKVFVSESDETRIITHFVLDKNQNWFSGRRWVITVSANGIGKQQLGNINRLTCYPLEFYGDFSKCDSISLKFIGETEDEDAVFQTIVKIPNPNKGGNIKKMKAEWDNFDFGDSYDYTTKSGF